MVQSARHTPTIKSMNVSHSARTAALWHKYLLIAGLYLAQGLPGGLIAYTLPVLMREQGVAQM